MRTHPSSLPSSACLAPPAALAQAQFEIEIEIEPENAESVTEDAVSPCIQKREWQPKSQS
ncbi:hypothetical protein PG984_001963 [Apiospora sp. TS-2023a]